MQTTHYITLDLHDMISPVVVNVKQTDTARWLEITLSEDGRAVEIPEGTTGTISFVWQGSSGVYGVPTISGNKITYKLPSEVTASPGRKHAEIALRKMNNGDIEEQLYTASFDVLVYGVTVANAQASDDSYEALDTLLGQASAFLANKLITDVSYDASTDTLTISLVDGDGNESTKTLTGLKGAKGDTGVGVSRVDRISVTGGTQITIYLDNGDYTRFTVLDGVDGAPGAPGAPGASGQDGVGVASVDSTAVAGGHLITITLTNGDTESFTVYDGQDGQDGSLPVYTLEWHSGTDEQTGTVHPTPEEIAANTEVLNTIKNLPAGSFLLFLDVSSQKIPSVYIYGAFADFINWADGMKYTIGLMGSSDTYRQAASAYPAADFDDTSYDPAAMLAIANYIDTRIGTSGNIDWTSIATKSEVNAKYTKPSAGIPESEFTTSTQQRIEHGEAAYVALPNKQNTLTAGNGIDITNNVISATGGGGGMAYTAGTGIDITNDVISVDNTVQPKPSQVTTGTNITLADNTEYRLTDVTTLTLAYPSGNFECWLRLTFAASGTITVTLPTSEYIGSAPIFANGETWELSIKDGVVVAGKVEATT